jgi:glutaredoxin 3
MQPKIEVYVTDTCPYCTAAVQLLRRKQLEFELFDVTGDEQRRRWLREASGRHTVPQVFIDGAPVGGFTDLAALEAEGRLDAMVWRGGGTGTGAGRGTGRGTGTE